MSPPVRPLALVGLALLATATPLFAQSAAPLDAFRALRAADSLYAAGDRAAAIAPYETVVEQFAPCPGVVPAGPRLRADPGPERRRDDPGAPAAAGPPGRRPHHDLPVPREPARRRFPGAAGGLLPLPRGALRRGRGGGGRVAGREPGDRDRGSRPRRGAPPATQIFIARMERWTDAIFVGECSSSSPNFTGEETSVRLPWSGVRGSVSSRHNQVSDPMDDRAWIDVDLRVPLTAADYFAGRDPVMEAVERAILAEN